MKQLKLESLNRISKEEFKSTQKKSVVILLENIRSAYNIGSIFRNADAFLIEKIILCGFCATPPHKEIQKTALGAQDNVDWIYYKEPKQAIEAYKKLGYQILAIEQTTKSITLDKFLIKKNENYLLVFGNEVNGISQEMLDLCKNSIEIPQSGAKHSLNVSVCAGIVLWEFYKKL
jgi:23S rRNA (guanosine2251-2'-O)-methyltransferase